MDDLSTLCMSLVEHYDADLAIFLTKPAGKASADYFCAKMSFEDPRLSHNVAKDKLLEN